MRYKSVDEINNFRFDDCVINSISESGSDVSISAEALIVCANNSQNSNYTESYAGITQIRFTEGRIKGLIKDGYKYYDANEVLISEVEDSVIANEDIKAFLKTCEGAYLYEISEDKENNCYILGIEFEDAEDNTVGDSYRLTLECEKIIIEWDEYLNKVQKM